MPVEGRVDAGKQESGRWRVGAAALLLASSVLLSRVLGYAREMLLAYRVGAGAETDAYYAAFQIPDLLNYLLAGGALSIAFLPLYAKQLARGEAGAAQLFATVLGSLSTVAVVLTLLLWWFAEPLVALQFPRFDAETQELTVRLTRIVLPGQICFIAGGIVNATLLARDRFGASAVAPLLYNAGIIAGGLLLAPAIGGGVEGFAWGALGGAVLGPLAAPLIDARGRVAIRWRLAPFDRAFLRYLAVAAPLMLGQTLLTVDEWYERWFGALLGEGTVAHLAYARRLMLVPVAVVGQAIAAAALPTLSRLYAEGKLTELNQLVLRTLQAGFALAIFGAAGVWAVSPALVEVIYQRGAFTPADTLAVSAILSVMAFAVPAWILQQIAARAFYARGDTWRPMLLGTAIAMAAIPLYLMLGTALGVLGLAAAGALAMTINAFATVALAHWLHRAPELTPLLRTGARAALIASLAAAAARLLVSSSQALSPNGASTLVAATALFAVLLGCGVALFGDPTTRAVFRRLIRRVRRKRDGA
jgi:putative peptidoglycan lipid II flippase